MSRLKISLVLLLLYIEISDVSVYLQDGQHGGAFPVAHLLKISLIFTVLISNKHACNVKMRMLLFAYSCWPV